MTGACEVACMTVCGAQSLFQISTENEHQLHYPDIVSAELVCCVRFLVLPVALLCYDEMRIVANACITVAAYVPSSVSELIQFPLTVTRSIWVFCFLVWDLQVA